MVGRPGVMSTYPFTSLCAEYSYPYRAGLNSGKKVVKILQECKIHTLLHIFIRFMLGKPCREVYGNMFITDCRLELRFIAGRQPVNSFLPHLFLAAAGRDSRRSSLSEQFRWN